MISNGVYVKNDLDVMDLQNVHDIPENFIRLFTELEVEPA
jgi:hypothetical protein